MKRRLILVLPLAVIAGLGMWAYSWWQQPAASSVNTAAVTDDAVLGSTTTLVPWQTSYFSTRIPNNLHAKTSNETNGSASYLLTSASGENSDQIGITVAKLGTNALSETPGVKLRLNQPETYARTSRSYAPADAFVFTSNIGYETALFWQHNTIYVGVAASGSPARSGELEQALAAIVSNWQWQ